MLSPRALFIMAFVPVALIFYMAAFGAERDRHTGKRIKYRKYTEYDFSGITVKGKARSPEVFYIFQRKRAGDQSFVHAPIHFNHHRDTTTQLLLEKVTNKLK